jgi:hypothetical protein
MDWTLAEAPLATRCRREGGALVRSRVQRRSHAIQRLHLLGKPGVPQKSDPVGGNLLLRVL